MSNFLDINSIYRYYSPSLTATKLYIFYMQENLSAKSDTKRQIKHPDRLLLRLPSDLRERIQENAKRSGRTMTAEILLQLAASYRFNEMQMEMAEQREYIVLRQVERAIAKVAGSLFSREPQSNSDDQLQGSERLALIHKTLESILINMTSETAVRREIRPIDSMVTDVLETVIDSQDIVESCWRARGALGNFMTSRETSSVYAQDVRTAVRFLASEIRDYLAEKALPDQHLDKC